MSAPYTKKEVEILIALRKSGVPDKEIAKHLKRSMLSVRAKGRRLGVASVKAPDVWTKEELNLLKELRESGATVKHIAKKLNRSTSAISNKSRKQEFPSLLARGGWKPEEDATLGNGYAKGTPIKKIAETLARGERTVAGRARTLGLTSPSTPSTFHEDLFETLTAESAYWLGFVAADGHVKNGPRAYQITVTLGKKDRDQLGRFARFCGSNKSPRKVVGKRQDGFSFYIARKKIVQRVVGWGVGPDKTHNLHLPTWDESLLRPFLLGFSDGDGHISTKCWNLAIHEPIATQLQRFITSHFDIPCGVYDGVGVRHLVINGSYAKIFLDWLYADALVYMPRKFAAYQELSGHVDSTTSRIKKAEIRKLKQFLNDGHTLEECATLLGRSYTGTLKAADRHGFREPIKPNWSQGEVDTARTMGEAGATTNEIAEHLNRSIYSVRSYLARHNIPFNNQRGFWTPEKQQQLTELLPLGLSWPQIAKRLGCPKANAKEKAKRMGLKKS